MTKKTFKPVFTVDITDCETYGDVMLAIALAKALTFLSPEQYDRFLAASDRETIEAVLDTFFWDNNAIVWEEDGFITLDLKKYELTDDEHAVINQTGLKIVPNKKPGIFKRFWNWITCKK